MRLLPCPPKQLPPSKAPGLIHHPSSARGSAALVFYHRPGGHRIYPPAPGGKLYHLCLRRFVLAGPRRPLFVHRAHHLETPATTPVAPPDPAPAPDDPWRRLEALCRFFGNFLPAPDAAPGPASSPRRPSAAASAAPRFFCTISRRNSSAGIIAGGHPPPHSSGTIHPASTPKAHPRAHRWQSPSPDCLRSAPRPIAPPRTGPTRGNIRPQKSRVAAFAALAQLQLFTRNHAPPKHEGTPSW